jgi:serine/threonine-protein kinase HipA
MTIDPLDLISVDRADIYKRGVLAAHFHRRRDGVEFEYLPDYLHTGRPAIATTLPLTPTAHLTPAGAVPPYFAGLLPEGRRLSALRRAVKSSADDDLSLLLAVGADLIGDVQVLPHGELPTETSPAVRVSAFADVDFADLFKRSLGDRLDRVGIPGIQDKVSAQMISLPVEQAGDRFILKLNPPEFPALVENEAFFIQAARDSGLNTVETKLVQDVEGRQGLLVRRFDRITDAQGNTAPLSFEDGCQILDRYPADKYAVSSEDVGLALIALAAARQVAAREVFRQFVFAYLTANGDAHAKNFAMLQRPDGEWRVSPAFDLPTSHVYGDHTLALTIQGKRREDLTRQNFITFGSVLGLNERAALRVIDELCDRADGWLPKLDQLPFDPARIHKLRRAIEYRRKRLRAGKT